MALAAPVGEAVIVAVAGIVHEPVHVVLVLCDAVSDAAAVLLAVSVGVDVREPVRDELRVGVPDGEPLIVPDAVLPGDSDRVLAAVRDGVRDPVDVAE